MSSKIAITALIIILALVNWSIAAKEKHLAEGKIVYLHLAPVDPRSLMQGDYMALRFSLANEVYNALLRKNKSLSSQHLEASDGFMVANVDDKNIATFKRIYNDETLTSDEILMQYRIRKGSVKFASNAFFFQEGHGAIYQSALYGEFSVNDKGELLLVAMYDHALNKLKPIDKNNSETSKLFQN